MRTEERAKDVIYITTLFVLTILFFEQMIFHNKILLLRDLYCDFIPWRTFARESIRSGVMPLWNPYSSLGQPFIAFPQTAVFYPLNLMFYVFPIITALRWFIVLHIFLAGFFMYILMKHWNVIRIAAFVSAIIFMFNGVIISRLEFLSFVSTIIWVPLLFYLLDNAIKKRSVWWGTLTGVVMSIQLLAGHTQTFYYTYLLLCLYWIVRITIQGFTTRDTKSITKQFFVLPLATIIAISLSMIQLLPTLELTRLSVRMGNYDPQSYGTSLHPSHLLTFLIPYLFGVPGYTNVYWGITLFEFWAGSFYVGIFPLILSLFSITISLFHKKYDLSSIDSFDRNTSNNLMLLSLLFSALVLWLIILSLGMYTPVFNFFYTYFPLFNKFRWPSRIMELAVFAISIIAGVGIHCFLSIIQNSKDGYRKEPLNCLCLILKILIIFDVIFIILFLFGYFMPTKILSLIKEYISTVHFEEIPTSLETRYAQIMRGYTYMLISFNAGIMLYFLGFTRRANLKVLHVLVPLIIVADLFCMCKNLNYYSKADVYKTMPNVIKYLKSDKDLFRVGSMFEKPQQYLYGLKNDSIFLWAKSVLTGETSLPNHIFKAVGGGELKINYYIKFMEFLSNNVHSKKIGYNFLQLLNVKYIISGEDMYDILFRNGRKEIIISKNDKNLPRTFVVGKATLLNNEAEIFKKLFSEDFDHFKEIIIEATNKDTENLSFEKKTIYYKVKKLDYTPNKIEIDVELDNNGFLVLSDTYYPGWKAYIDGKETTIYKTDYILRSVFLEKGTHNVEFIYDPISFKIGYIITLSTTFVLIIIGILKYRNYTVKKVSNSKVY